MNCINCHFSHEYKHCPNCGQSSEVPKITFGTIFDNAFSTFANMDKGVLYNIKMLTLKPRELITDYLKGKRRGIFNPISYLIIMSTLYILVESTHFSFFASNYFERSENVQSGNLYSFAYKIGRFLKYSFKYFWILSAVWLGLGNKIVFSKYNFAEHLAISSFVIGHTTLLITIWQVVFGGLILFNPFTYGLVLWMCYRVFKDDEEHLFRFWKSALSTFILMVILAAIAMLIGVGINYWDIYQVES